MVSGYLPSTLRQAFPTITVSPVESVTKHPVDGVFVSGPSRYFLSERERMSSARTITSLLYTHRCMLPVAVTTLPKHSITARLTNRIVVVIFVFSPCICGLDGAWV